MTTTIVWFRRDLRLGDHPALRQAAQDGKVIPLYILDPNETSGAAERWWRHHSLQHLIGSVFSGKTFLSLLSHCSLISLNTVGCLVS